MNELVVELHRWLGEHLTRRSALPESAAEYYWVGLTVFDYCQFLDFQVELEITARSRPSGSPCAHWFLVVAFGRLQCRSGCRIKPRRSLDTYCDVLTRMTFIHAQDDLTRKVDDRLIRPFEGGRLSRSFQLIAVILGRLHDCFVHRTSIGTDNPLSLAFAVVHETVFDQDFVHIHYRRTYSFPWYCGKSLSYSPAKLQLNT